MSDSSAPRRVEMLLEALGADTEFCEAIIGDLAEEYAIRETWDGPAVARRWYYRESMRVAPHLLRNWCSGLRRRDIRDFGPVVIISSVFMLVLEAFGLATVRGLSYVLGAPHGALSRFWENPLGSAALPALMLIWTLGDGMFAGYIAARLSRRAPLPSALSLAAAWTGTIVVLNAMIGVPALHAPIPAWFRAMNLTALVCGMIAGGVLRACTARHPEVRSSVVEG